MESNKVTTKTGGYLKLGNNIIFCPFLPLEAKALFAYIKSKPENWCFSSDRMAKELGVGVSTIKKYRAVLENTTTNKDDPSAPMLIVKHRTHEGFYTYQVNEPSFEIQPVKIQPVKIQPVEIQPIKKEKKGENTTGKKKIEFRGDEKKGFKRRQPVADEKTKIAKHFAEVNAEADEKGKTETEKAIISKWKKENPEAFAEMEKENRARLESERPHMLMQARNAMVAVACNMQIRKMLFSE